MAEGTKTYAGLAVPLFGESEIVQQDISKDILTLTSHADNASADFLVCQDSDGVENFIVEDDGRTRIKRSGAFSECLSAYYTCTQDDPGSTQEYGCRFGLDEATYIISGGRRAVIELGFNASIAGSRSNASFIHISDNGEAGTALFSFGLTQTQGGCMEVVSNPNSTIGLVIYQGNQKFWILCSSVST